MGYHLPLNKIDKVDFSSTIIKKTHSLILAKSLGDCALQGILGKYCPAIRLQIFLRCDTDVKFVCHYEYRVPTFYRTLKNRLAVNKIPKLQDIITLFFIIIGIKIDSLSVILV